MQIMNRQVGFPIFGLVLTVKSTDMELTIVGVIGESKADHE